MDIPNSQLLFAYLRSMLHDTEDNKLDISALEEPYVQLGEEVHQLKHKADELARQAELMQSYNELLTELTKKRDEWVMVVNAEDKSILYCNKRKGPNQTEDGSCEFCYHQLAFRQYLLDWNPDKGERIWEAEDGCGQSFLVLSFALQWKEKNANAHIVTNVTEEKQRTRQLHDKAYSDPGTGIFNRHYLEEQLDLLLIKRKPHVLAYLDLDGLKYVNDKFGHLEGDEYIRNFVSMIQTRIRMTDIFARIGGDEFVVLFMSCPENAARQKLQGALDTFIRENTKEYPVSFSFGVLSVTGREQELTREKLLQQADKAMYLCKQENKKKYHQHTDWTDSRLEKQQ